MPRALIDTTVLFAAAYTRDSSHDAALPMLRGIDDGTLPEAVVLDYVLAETLNGLTTHAGHDAAVDLLDRIEENARFHIDSLNTDAFATGKPRESRRSRSRESRPFPSPSSMPAKSSANVCFDIATSHCNDRDVGRTPPMFAARGKPGYGLWPTRCEPCRHRTAIRPSERSENRSYAFDERPSTQPRRLSARHSDESLRSKPNRTSAWRRHV